MNLPVHESVLVEESLDFLDPGPGRTLLDLTVGAGGHALAWLTRSGPAGRLIGIDRDAAILDLARERLAPFGDQVALEEGVSTTFVRVLERLGVATVDGVLMDLGVSSLQLDDGTRGFSIQHDGPLDMRMSGGRGVTARQLLERSDADTLAGIFERYGDEPRAKMIAKRLEELCRRRAPRTTHELAAFIATILGRSPNRPRRVGEIHPATRVFQALRIAVNEELSALETTLSLVGRRVAVGGKVVVISFHSLEDRIVKNFFRDGERAGRWEILTPKPLRPSAAEVARNPRSRSAVLRAARWTGDVA